MDFETISGKADEQVARGRTDEARLLLRRGLSEAQRQRNFGYIDFFHGELAVLDEEFQLALEYHLRALKSQPENPLFLRCLAATYSMLGRDKEALEAYDQTLKVDPTDRVALMDAAQCSERLGRPKNALEYLGQLRELAAKSDEKSHVAQLDAKIETVRAKVEGRPKAAPTGERRPARAAEAAKEPPTEGLRRVLAQFAERKDPLFQTIRAHEEKFQNFTSPQRSIPTDFPSFLCVLRRWGTVRPIMPATPGGQRGGGYFLFHKGLGLVVDPGPNFIDNFYEEGFHIADIDAILVTHAHQDHMADLEGILTLVHRLNDRVKAQIEAEVKGKGKQEGAKAQEAVVEALKKRGKRVDLFLNFGVFTKASGWLSLRKSGEIRETQVMHPGHEYALTTEGAELKINAMKANHHEGIDNRYCIGIVIDAEGCRVAFTSDTAWDAEGKLADQYEKLSPNLVVAHLGGIEEKEFAYADAKTDEERAACFRRQDLGLLGVTSLLQRLKPKLAVLGEFGPELGPVRKDIAHALTESLGVQTLPGDIGLTIRLSDLAVRCFVSKQFVDCEQVGVYAEPDGPSLHYFGGQPSYESFTRALAEKPRLCAVPLAERTAK
ncbi:MAG: MBL fold metallo-hydrolase [Planctomycetes bacterium]|nr:MBL fold metallo-hydrolase [Planctomycetota bacterium]